MANSNRDATPPTSSNAAELRFPAALDASTASISATGAMSASDRLAEQGGLESESSSNTARPRNPRVADYGSLQTSSGARPPLLQSPTSVRQSGKRPGAIGRQGSFAAPHRGDKFSVDDDANEVDEDVRQAKTQSRQDSQRERNMRRRESTLRRRPTGHMTQAPLAEGDEYSAIQSSGNDITATVSSLATEREEPSSEETLQGEEEVEEPVEEVESSANDDDDTEDADLSDAESFTLKDRQEAINETHPFGIRIWKPALYKKNRSVQRNAEGDIHSAPGGSVGRWLWAFNALWTVIFGWWMALVVSLGGIVCLTLGLFQKAGSPGCQEYGRVLINLAHYLIYPFGKYVLLERDEAYLAEDEGEGRGLDEYERWQAGDLEEGRLFFGPTDISRSIIGRRRDEVPDLEETETDSLLGRRHRENSEAQQARSKTKQRLFGRGKWNLGRVIFFLSFYLLITPCLLVVSGVCWFLVFTIPMGKVTLLLFYHMRRHPLAMSFHTDSHYSRAGGQPRGPNDSVILLCTYRAVGLKYWKYTIDGTNIFLINLLGLVVFAILDYFVLYETLHIDIWITSPGFVFVLALVSIIPLAYFIGQAVASISAQSSMGVGATINAFFSTVVEVFLYCVALQEGKAQLVEGSIVGSIFAGILFLPGLSMCFGALKRKTQRFNVRSAGVTSTMLLFAVIGAFGPTLFYQIYGSHVLNCKQCVTFHDRKETERDCRRCYFSQVPDIHDRFFKEAVRPYIWFAAVCLFLSYVVGLLFTLRTHAAVIWNNEPDEKKDAKTEPTPAQLQNSHASVTDGNSVHNSARHATGAVRKDDIRDSQMYKRILQQSLKVVSAPPLPKSETVDETFTAPKFDGSPFIVPPRTAEGEPSSDAARLRGLSAEDNRALVQQVAEIAATAAAVAARDATRVPRRASAMSVVAAGGAPSAARHHSISRDPKDTSHTHHHGDHPPATTTPTANTEAPLSATPAVAEESHSGGHDAPNWSRTKSAVILLTATVAYAIIAEILVDTVDAVLANIDIDEKFLGITLFALVPNTTEFLNAISFAMNGNVALSMEIGSSYALQVMLLQIPCLVLFSAIYIGFWPIDEILDHTFTLVFPQWDMVTVILAVFLMGWVVAEGKSNYFKGSILIFTYLVVVVGFWFSGYGSMDMMGIDRFDTLAIESKAESFRTIGRTTHGPAF